MKLWKKIFYASLLISVLWLISLFYVGKWGYIIGYATDDFNLDNTMAVKSPFKMHEWNTYVKVHCWAVSKDFYEDKLEVHCSTSSSNFPSIRDFCLREENVRISP
jgi:hypothetical protein